MEEITCISKDGVKFNFQSQYEGTGIEYEVNEDMGLDFKNFIKAIEPGKTIKANTPQGDVLTAVVQEDGRLSAKVNYANGDKYEGELSGIYRDGKGTFETKYIIFEGNFKEGSFTGQGTKKYKASNRVTSGEYLDGEEDGFGEDTWINFTEDSDELNSISNYVGQFAAGEYHGLGRMENSYTKDMVGIGIVYEEFGSSFFITSLLSNSPALKSGKIKEGDKIISLKNTNGSKVYAKDINLEQLKNLISGKARRSIVLELEEFDEESKPLLIKKVSLKREAFQDKYTYIYDGRWVNGKKNGYGKEETSDGRTYEGTFKDGIYDGFGKRTWGEGKTYFGAYKDGQCEGSGIELNQNYEIVYYGEFQECLAHGEGGSIYHAPDGTKVIKSGSFLNNQLNGYGEVYYPNGTTYKGFWKDDIWTGYGEYYDPEFKATLSGTYEFGALKDGQGSYVTDDYRYVGEFKDSKFHGKGKESTRTSYILGDASPWSEEDHVIMSEGKFVRYYEPTEAVQEKRVALVIGNAAYASSRLENSVNDSVGMAKTLEEKGFKVIHKKNLTQKQFKKIIWDFSELVDSYQGKVTALFFYAGHAVQIEGDNYLIPIDSRMNQQREIELESINAQSIINSLSKATNGVKILILDSCRNNPFKSYSRDISGGLAQMSAPLGTFIAYSTSPGEVALDGNARGYGIYTGNLINALNSPGLNIEQVFKKTRLDVANVTNGKQIPWESSSLIGDFYFLK
ncbi:caspase family protein [Gammaproteobacteria bacterium]|nr:caspase family protein [Gammaproteobacteria bacterium]